MHSLGRFAGLVVTSAILFFVAGQNVYAATCTWNGSVDSAWTTAGNWTGCTGGGAPATTDDVLLDNSSVSGSYTVNLPTGGTSIVINKLTITPDSGNTITLILPSGNTAIPGLNVGDSAASTDDIILNNGAVLQNSSGAGSGNGIQVNTTSNGTIRINNGGKYLHNTARSTGGIIPRLSTAAGTETGLFEYDVPGTGSFAISASGRTFGSLTLTRTAGAATYTASGTNSLTVRGNFTINSGITFNSSMSSDMFVAGNWTNAGTYTSTSQPVTFNGSAQTLVKSGAGSTETFCNLTIASSATLNTGDDMVAVSGGGSCGTLTQSGKLVRTTPSQNITNGGGAVTFTDSRNVNTAIVTQTGGSDMGATTVTVTSNAGAPACGNRIFRDATILRWYDIAPTNVSGVTATVRLYYRTTNPNEANGITPADVRIYHCDGAYWNELGGTTGSDGAGEYVELTGVTTFSPFGLAPQNAPTSAILGRFRAQATPKHQVRVKWNTEAEWNVVGFNLYRQTAGRKKWTKLNGDTPIERKDVSSPDGARYKWNDKQVKAGKTYRYKLEILKVSGPAEWSEVVQVTVP